MKFLFVILLAPILSFGQTVHVKDKKIEYSGTEKIEGKSAEEIFKSIRDKLPIIIGGYKPEKQSSISVEARGSFKLATPYRLQRTVSYSFEFKAKNNGYEYLIDSVSFTDQERGGKPVTKSSEEMLDNMGETGKIVGDTEKILNETDMRFQQIIALIKSSIQK